MKKSIICTMFLALALGLSSCASNQKKNAAANVGSASAEDLMFEVNADSDSDSKRAGGLRTVYFAYDSANLSSEAKEVLEANAEVLKAAGNVSVQVEGHCDERGGVQYNLALGEKRAKSVMNYLVALGVESSRVSTISFGKERPLEFGHDESAWSRNRRGNFVVTAK